MSYSTRADQARCAALGFWPGPIDGFMGKRTREALAAARASQKAKGLPFIHESGLSRIHLHWSGGAYKANATDLRAYHVLIEGDGKIIAAHHPTKSLSHTLNANSGAIGVSLCAMAGAVERPFNAGRYPITPEQLRALADVVRGLCQAYDIPVSRYSVLTHAEVQPTLGIKQRFKWDIIWLPGMAAPVAPLEAGDRLRAMIEAPAPAEPPAPVPPPHPAEAKLARIAAILAE